MSSTIPNTVITLPSLIIERKSIGGNTVTQLAESEHSTEVEITKQSSTSFLLTDNLNREIYLTLPRSKDNFVGKEYVIQAKGISNISQLSEKTELRWKAHKLQDVTKDPVAIADSWKGIFWFKEEDPSNKIKGLRKPQIGAIHGVASHWTKSSECGTVVMPTGTGKTEVMLSVLVMERCAKLVVIVPSSSLRDQTFNKFVKLGHLPLLGVTPNSIIFPRVAYVKHGIKTVEDCHALMEASNVVIATASALKESDDSILSELAKLSTHLFIDEAHHTPAESWTKIKSLFAEKPILQFTATPFRRDGKRIEGDIIYDYPLGLAQENKYFTEINLIKISEINDKKADKEIATKAIAALEADLKNGLDHIVMARTSDIKRAEEIWELYKTLGGKHNPLIVHNRLKAPEERHVFEQLKSRRTRIIVCVNMLGEGYDFPNLKIAALHDIHKNLTTTLQFVGRFTRNSVDKIGNATIVVNSADQKVEKNLEELYAENPDWNKILRHQSESTIKKEKDLQELIKNFNGDLSKQVSIWNLRPSLSCFVYTTDCDSWSPLKYKEALPSAYACWPAVNQSEKLLVFVVSREEEVKWGKYRDIKDLTFELVVAHWDQDSKRLFIHASDYDAIDCNKLAKAICGDNTKVIEGNGLFNLFSEINHPMVRNLGAAKTGTISFTMYFGPEVTTGLSEIDKAESMPNNIFAWGYEAGDMVTYGCSAKSGKVWSHGGGSIVEWKEWCVHINEKILTEASGDTLPEIIKGFLRPLSLNGRHKSVPVGVEWGERLLQAPESRVFISLGTTEYSMFETSLEIADFSEDGPIKIFIEAGSSKSEYEIDYVTGTPTGSCSYNHVSGPRVSIRKHSGAPVPLEEYLIKDPVVIRYADASFSYGNYHVSTPNPDNFYDPENLEPITWTVNIFAESEGKGRDSNTIQYQVIESIKGDYDIIINDDDAYEAGDIIGIRKDSDHEFTLHLIHCKYCISDVPGGDIRNLYELCGQAQKCIKWKHRGFDVLYEHIKKREEKWAATGHTRFIKGDMNDLLTFKKFARSAKAKLEVSICQPGLSKRRAGTDIRQLLACTENYLLKTSEARLKVICSG